MNTREKYAEMLESEEHERRMRAIAQNGNNGEHYTETMTYEKDMLYGFNKSVNDIEVEAEVVEPTDKAAKRKATPVYSGFIKYFPNAIKEVAECSMKANRQHNGDEPLHWAMEKSKDELDALMRHLIDHASGIDWDDDNIRHLTKVCWRSLAMLERTLTNKF